MSKEWSWHPYPIMVLGRYRCQFYPIRLRQVHAISLGSLVSWTTHFVKVFAVNLCKTVWVDFCSTMFIAKWNAIKNSLVQQIAFFNVEMDQSQKNDNIYGLIQTWNWLAFFIAWAKVLLLNLSQRRRQYRHIWMKLWEDLLIITFGGYICKDFISSMMIAPQICFWDL